MPDFQIIHDAHAALIEAVRLSTKPGAQPIPISLVSVQPNREAQLVIFDGTKHAAQDVAERLRLAADMIDSHSDQGRAPPKTSSTAN